MFHLAFHVFSSSLTSFHLFSGSFSAVYPQVEEKLLPNGGQSVLWRAHVEKNGDMKMLGGLSSDGNVEEGLEVSYLYWEGESFELSISRHVFASFADFARCFPPHTRSLAL